MVSIYGRSQYDVTFRMTNGQYEWVGESQMCEGPAEYENVDGHFHERIVISYFHYVTRQYEGWHAGYWGPHNRELSRSEAESIWKKWGC